MALSVLIVDDNPDLLKLYVATFPVLAADITLLTAADGEQGLVAFFERTPRPDCVVIDISMPQLNGNQLVRTLRGDPDTADTPLIILTAMPPDQFQFEGFAAGTDRFLSKPVTPQALIDEIRAAVGISPEDRLQRYRAFAEEEG